MRLTSILTPQRIEPDLHASSKQEAVERLARIATADLAWARPEEVARVLLERERIASTGVGEGIAIPHASYERSPEMTLALARSKEGVAYDAIDGKPVHLFFVLLVPTDQPGPHLKTLARISRLLKNHQTRHDLVAATDAEGMLDALVAAEDALG